MVPVRVLQVIKGGIRNFAVGEIVQLPAAEAKQRVRDGQAEYVADTAVVESAKVEPAVEKSIVRKALHSKRDS